MVLACKNKLTEYEEWHPSETSQQRTSCETTAYSLLSSAYWYLIGGTVPSSSDTNINSSSTFRCNNCCFCSRHTEHRQVTHLQVNNAKINIKHQTVHFTKTKVSPMRVVACMTKGKPLHENSLKARKQLSPRIYHMNAS